MFQKCALCTSGYRYRRMEANRPCEGVCGHPDSRLFLLRTIPEESIRVHPRYWFPELRVALGLPQHRLFWPDLRVGESWTRSLPVQAKRCCCLRRELLLLVQIATRIAHRSGFEMPPTS